ncbi:MAG TPA: FAD-dependent oxidoreductase [Thermoanaerobaculia bacterium]|nr:FAD-dependent oxidoreductase [Thermoanaerobaculia bacterium]
MRTHAATVTEIADLAPQVLQLTIALREGDFHFEPGQWVNFRFPEGVSRAYTIASAPERHEALQLCIRIGSGRGGEALRKLARGANVTIEGPFGDFLLPRGGHGPVVFLAGDTGIAPVRSIVLHMLAVDDGRAIIVLYEPDRRHILYAGDFDPLARSGRIVHESGRIETLIERNRKSLAGAVVMAAGFEPFLDRVRKSLGENGIDAAGVVSESFGPQP